MNTQTNRQSAKTKAKPTGSGMVLTERDRRLIEAVEAFGIVTREQIARHLRFGSVTRANSVLLRLFRHGYLGRRLQPSLRGTRRLTYFVGPKGHELIGISPKSVDTGRRRWPGLSDLFVDHQLDLNDVRLTFEHLHHSGYEFVRFLSERELSLMSLPLVPDGYCEYRIDGKAYAAFLEVDRGTEPRSRWTAKVAAYLQLAYQGMFAEKFGRRFFRVLVTAPSARRVEGIAHEVSKRTDRIFWVGVHGDVLREGPLASVWHRPNGTGPTSLTETIQ
jgi:hypothetical protein